MLHDSTIPKKVWFILEFEWALLKKRINLDKLIKKLTKDEERSLNPNLFRNQDSNIKTGTIRNPRQNSQQIHDPVFSKSANPLNSRQKSPNYVPLKAKSVNLKTYSPPSTRYVDTITLWISRLTFELWWTGYKEVDMSPRVWQPFIIVSVPLMTSIAHLKSDQLQFLVISFLTSRQVNKLHVLTLTPKPVFLVAYFLCLLCTHNTAYNDGEKKEFKTTLTSGHCQCLQTGFQAATSSFTQFKVKVQCVVSCY